MVEIIRFIDLKKSLTKISLLTSLLAILSPFVGQAQIISPSAQEVAYRYTASFSMDIDDDYPTDQERAEFHASHLMGLFHSPKMVEQFSINPTVGGIGAPRTQMKIVILSSVKDGKRVSITYSNSGKMILHKLAAEALLKKGELTVPMPLDPYAIYRKSCTDEHYTSLGDYWYFYDIFRPGCEYLGALPYSEAINISIFPSNKYQSLLESARLQLGSLRGNNENGSVFSIYVIHGFAEGPKDKADEGRVNYVEFNDYLLSRNFKKKAAIGNAFSSRHAFEKEITLDNGKKMVVEVNHLLIETGIEARSKVFALFFKKAVAEADVIFYGGHSGLGGNLDIPSLEKKAGPFEFNLKKKQIFFFESCSSYSYYLETFAAEKTKAKIDVITNGLSSYFHTASKVLNTFIDQLLTTGTTDPLWIDVLRKIESKLGKDTYLINVGAI